MNVALFGGTFDPIHSGHLSAACAAQQTFELDQILFVPAYVPPHKQGRPLTAFSHRYAMVALACASSPRFVPSLLEAASENSSEPNYSILTVRKLAAKLSPADRLFFLIGADAFLEIGHWHEPVALLESCDFIIVSRPGFPIAQIEEVIPQGLRTGPVAGGRIPLRRTSLHLLTSVEADISSSTIRLLASQGQSLQGLAPVMAAVEAARDKKAQKIVVLELKGVADFADYFLICSGTSSRHVQTISDAIERQLGLSGLRPAHVEGYNHAEWVLMDYLDFVIHIFSEQARAFYDLERLWRTARRVPVGAEA